MLKTACDISTKKAMPLGPTTQTIPNIEQGSADISILVNDSGSQSMGIIVSHGLLDIGSDARTNIVLEYCTTLGLDTMDTCMQQKQLPTLIDFMISCIELRGGQE
jgi:hypothetical protein